jgi:cell division septation protein DedD
VAAAPAPQRPAVAPAVKPTGKYQVQLATVRTKEEAKALAAKAQRELAGLLASREAEIDQAVLGNMGSFYRLRFGPYSTVQETQAVCAKVKGSGFDCMAVTQ